MNRLHNTQSFRHCWSESLLRSRLDESQKNKIHVVVFWLIPWEQFIILRGIVGKKCKNTSYKKMPSRYRSELGLLLVMWFGYSLLCCNSLLSWYTVEIQFECTFKKLYMKTTSVLHFEQYPSYSEGAGTASTRLTLNAFKCKAKLFGIEIYQNKLVVYS